MSRHIQRLSTTRQYTADAADMLESAAAAIQRGVNWEEPRFDKQPAGAAMVGFARAVLVRDAIRAQKAAWAIIEAVEFHLDAEGEIRMLTDD